MPPEYIDSGMISDKYDVFSLGVIIIKMMAGYNGYFRCNELPHKQFVEIVIKSWKERLQDTLGHSSQEINTLQVKACVDIALRCMHADQNRRPYIKDIVNELEDLELKIKKMSLASDQSKDRISLQTMELNILERIVAGIEEPNHLDFSLLQSVTDNFSEKKRIGVGGCGEVYKGVLGNGVVAVKRLFKSRTIKDKMFHREVKTLIKVKHPNIVRFLGYCSFTEEHLLESGAKTIMVEIRERLLCFEYIRNGSLDSHLTDEFRGLEWHTRYEIIEGICKGLLYLHKKGIIHMDLKPANVLLDDLMVPKITDFDLSRLEIDSQTATASRLVSLGYCAPEYLSTGISSCKSDIYSLGVIIIELVTGSNKPDITKALRRWRHRWNKSSKHTPLGYQQVTKCLELAEKCMQEDPTHRPGISDIIDKLSDIDSKGDQFQVIPCLEDMLGIEPLEIHFLFEHDQKISHSIELSNGTDDHFAFITKTRLRRLCAEPDKGIVPPRSTCSVTVTMMQAQVMALPNNRDHRAEHKSGWMSWG